MNVWIIFITCFFFIEGFGYVYLNSLRLKRTVHQCKITEYACKSGGCIDEDLLCDGKEDCSDGSDETQLCSSIVCKYGACINPKLRCNKVNDCKDNPDENKRERKPAKRSPIISNWEPGNHPKNSCILPQHPKNGKWIALHSSTVQPGDIVEINTVIAFSCDANYKLIPYVTLSLCLPDWTVLPKCVNTCPPLLPPQGISVSCNINGVATSCDNPAEGTNATVTCNNSFGYNPNPLITCRDGTWNYGLPTCTIKTCSSLLPTKKIHVTCTNKGESVSCRNPIEGTIATVTCAKNYKDPSIVNRNLIHCVEGKWDYPLPNCQPTCDKKLRDVDELIPNSNNITSSLHPFHVGFSEDDDYLCGGLTTTPKPVITDVCDLNCGIHGHCVSNVCQCNIGWHGENCENELCDIRCNEHGQCKNGSCLCAIGWYGRHCSLEGCPNSCSNHGQCESNSDGAWKCKCENGWDGPDCNILLEQNCNDKIDNDSDGLVDCEDPECCLNHVCEQSYFCYSKTNLNGILLRKQPSINTASFFERMKFIIQDGSVQDYARPDAFNESRAAVVRGRVVNQMGMGLKGVKVISSINFGFTITRDDGWYDYLVNGGGSVILKFTRSPFRLQSLLVFVPWNEIVIVDNVIMTTNEEQVLPSHPQPCRAHNFYTMRPIILASWKHGFQGDYPDKSLILSESQVVQESLQIPGTKLNLVYHSSRAVGYLSTIELLLTPESIPSTLRFIHLRILVEGILFEKTFEADPVIKFTYAWNHLDIYKHRVYGVATAYVKVGYQYIDCTDIIWDVQTTTLSGYDMAISDIGGWNLHIHHRYNFREGILRKGDGSNIYFKQKPHVILNTLGDGHQRPLDCTDCEGLVSKQRLLAPIALATAPDDSIFVGDFNLIRKILTDGTVKTIAKLNITGVSYRYHMAFSSSNGLLYISDPESHQIIRVEDSEGYIHHGNNWKTIIGSGERCLPGDETDCGDGGLAINAKLAYPKGVAVSLDNMVYFADGTNIRMVDSNGIIMTVIGNHMHKSHWKPIPCEGTLNLNEVHLRWPTELTINPIDNSLHIIDDNMILKLTSDGRINIVAGRPFHCAPPLNEYDTDLAIYSTLVMPQSIAFNAHGELFVAESDSQKINRVRVIKTNGKIALYAGKESKCSCLERECDCFDANNNLASNCKFKSISSLAISPQGHVHVADQASYRIRSIMSTIPHTKISKQYKIYSPETSEIYIFNEFGQHNVTKNILTNKIKYLFTYTHNSRYEMLTAVADAAGNKLFFYRDYANQVNRIENANGQKCILKIRNRMLLKLITPDNNIINFDYHHSTGLLKTKLDSSGKSFFYNYDDFGRLVNTITPTGNIISLSSNLSIKGDRVQVNSKKIINMLIKESTVSTTVSEANQEIILLSDGNVEYNKASNHSILSYTVPFSIVPKIDSLVRDGYRVISEYRSKIGGVLINRLEWKYFLRSIQNNSTFQVGRNLLVNGEKLLTFEYDQYLDAVFVFANDTMELLNVTYDSSSRPVIWTPANGIYAKVELEYDKLGRLTSWKWGDMCETYSFDTSGRLINIKYGDGSSITYSLVEISSNLQYIIITTSGERNYHLEYDKVGALQFLTTPRGYTHSFFIQTSLSFSKYQYFSPMYTHAYEIIYNDDGQILSKLCPHQSCKICYVYDAAGTLDTILAGLSLIQYTYYENTGLIKSIHTTEPKFTLNTEFKYHAGLLSSERLTFNSKSQLDNAHYKYSFDDNARLSVIDVNIDEKQISQLRLKYNKNLGFLEGINDLTINRITFNESVMQDTNKQFSTTINYDNHGRIKLILIHIKSLNVFKLEIDYDVRSRIKTQALSIRNVTSVYGISYHADGHILKVAGTNNWKYDYDENGNIISVISMVEEEKNISLGYDCGDRVNQYNGIEFINYDNRGYVVRRGEQKYRYNSHGELTHAFEKDRFETWYYYDDRNRLIGWDDNKGNVIKYFYSNPNIPDKVSHMYFPKSGETFCFHYDQRNVIIIVETNERRFYVATDLNGSPFALFDINGDLIKEIKRTPFGSIILDTNSNFYLPIDFHGGIYDPNTKLIYLNKRMYDPILGQWMTPAWEGLANKLSIPEDIFIYRFHNNDPINQGNDNYMIDLNSWLQLYGYNIRRMIGFEQLESLIYKPEHTVSLARLASDFSIKSGLQCMVEKITEKFSHLEFVSNPIMTVDSRKINNRPKIAYKEAIFGEGILLSHISGRTVVSVVDGANSTVQDVLLSVFNNSFFLDLHFNLEGKNAFYFVKDNKLDIKNDSEQLRRLGSMFNISTFQTNKHELRVHNLNTIIMLKYGADPQRERNRILRNILKKTVKAAWDLEKQSVIMGFQGRRNWSKQETEELLSQGYVDGYEGVSIHNFYKYPQIADYPGCIEFKKTSKK